MPAIKAYVALNWGVPIWLMAANTIKNGTMMTRIIVNLLGKFMVYSSTLLSA